MEKVLVLGASGQLGSTILSRLLRGGFECVAFVRPASDFVPPTSTRLQLAYGDMADYPSLSRACSRVDKVISTASAIIPAHGEKFGENEVDNYRNLVRACQDHGVGQLVYISAFSSEHDAMVPEFRLKRRIERLIVESGVPYTIFRGAPFMEIYFALMGSSLVLNGVSRPTLKRGFWLSRIYSACTSGLLEKAGVVLIPGDGKARHAFISIDDVAAFMVRAISLPGVLNRVIELGGPEPLSWNDVADRYSVVLGKRLMRIRFPIVLLRAMAPWLAKVSPAGGNILSLLYLLGRHGHEIDMADTCREFGIVMSTADAFIACKQELVQ